VEAVHSQGQAQAIIHPSRSVAPAIPAATGASGIIADPRPLRRVFRGETSQVPLVRDFIRRYLDGQPPCPAAQDIVLCAAELAANAVCHSRSGLPGGHLVVQVAAYPGEWVEVAVEDAGGQWTQRDSCDDDECGRGLQIVSALSIAAGVVTYGRGRTVWFRCAWDPEEDGQFDLGLAIPAQQEAAR
jgi:serine/threonine-protein kinase RsbW